MEFFPTFSKWLKWWRSRGSAKGNASQEPQSAPRIVFRSEDGRELTMDDLRSLSGTVRYEVIGTRNLPEAAVALHQQARAAGGAGDYKKAIALLEQASALAPEWPYPVYDRAFTHLLMDDPDGARAYYGKTLEMSPRGFFTATTALDTLTREQNGDLPVGTYRIYVSLEWMRDAAKKAETIRELVRMVPGFAPAWKEYAILCENHDERLAAIEKGLGANPDPDTKGMLEVNKALTLNLKGDRAAALRMLGELALDPESTFRTEHSAKVALIMLVDK